MAAGGVDQWARTSPLGAETARAKGTSFAKTAKKRCGRMADVAGGRSEIAGLSPVMAGGLMGRESDFERCSKRPRCCW